MKKYLFSLLTLPFCLLFNSHLQAQSVKTNEYNIIPYPAKLQPLAGHFTIDRNTALIVEPGTNDFNNERSFLKILVSNYLGSNALMPRGNVKGNAIKMKYDPLIGDPAAYKLAISPQLITISAKDPAGMFYAIETLRQLLPTDIETNKGKSLQIPSAIIEDKPAFQWRGMMLDVSRHFFSVQYLRKYVDMMALYKLNKLHLHLTDDQGWRIEIKKYPALTQESAWRTFNSHDSTCMMKAAETGNKDFIIDQDHIIHKNGKTLYGGFYTQEEMREFIKYAATRHVEIIPELDMPGHMMAAAKLYPWLTCDGLVGDLRDFSNPICPCNEKVLEFAKDIFSEIAELFPSKYIHIGGDEVNKKNWQKSAVVKAFMKEKGLTDMNQIQSYFNTYMMNFFKSKGKILVGWDEISEGTIDTSAIVMFWRPWAKEVPAKAAAQQNKVVMSPDGPLYFDAIPDAQTLSTVYHYDPLDTMYHINVDDQKRIIGIQANLWSEMVPSEKRADYMIMPRMTALAELGWTHRPLYDSYLGRLKAQYKRLDNLNVNYRLPDIDNLAENYAVIGKTPFFVQSPLPGFTIHYTTDGTLPDLASPLMEKPVIIDHALVLKLALFTPGGRRGDIYSLNFASQQYLQQENITKLKSGLVCEYYKGSFDSTKNIKGDDQKLSVSGINVPKEVTASTFGLKFKGYINVPESGIYTFYLNCDDGGVLRIGDNLVVDNDGQHSARQRGGQVGLGKGLHAFDLQFLEAGSGYLLDLKYSTGNNKPKPVPSSWFQSQIIN